MTRHLNKIVKAERVAQALASYEPLSLEGLITRTGMTRDQVVSGWNTLKREVGHLVALRHSGLNGAVYFRTNDPVDAEAYDLWLSRHLATREGTRQAQIVQRVEFTAHSGTGAELLNAVSDEATAREQVAALSGTVRALGLRLGYSESEIESWLPTTV